MATTEAKPQRRSRLLNAFSRDRDGAKTASSASDSTYGSLAPSDAISAPSGGSSGTTTSPSMTTPEPSSQQPPPQAAQEQANAAVVTTTTTTTTTTTHAGHEGAAETVAQTEPTTHPPPPKAGLGGASNFSRPLPQQGPPSSTSNGPGSSLKSAAATLHGAGEALRGSINARVDESVGGLNGLSGLSSRAAAAQQSAQAAAVEHRAVAAEGRGEMGSGRFGDGTRDREREADVGRVRKGILKKGKPVE